LALVIGVGAFFGHGYLKRHLTAKEALLVVQESRQILAMLRSEQELPQYQDKYNQASTKLGQAETLIDDGDYEAALPEAEVARSIASSILDRMRDRGLEGEAKFITIFGNVEMRRGDDGVWLSAKAQEVLEPGDWVRTNQNGSAVLMFQDGNLFTVRPDTVILVENRRESSTGIAEQTISLEYGWVNMSTSEAESRVLTPRAEAVVAKQSDGTVTYNEEEGKTRIAAFEGEIDVTTDEGETRKITAMQQIVQREGSLLGPSAILPGPFLLGPNNNYDTDLAADEIQLSWDPVPGATGYALQISPNSLFVDNVIDVEKRDKTTAKVGLRGDGNFHWRVAAHGSDGEIGEWSEQRKFRVNERSVTVGAGTGS